MKKMGIVRPRADVRADEFQEGYRGSWKEEFFQQRSPLQLPAQFRACLALFKRLFVFIVIFWNMALAKWKCSKWDSAQFSSE